MSVAEAVVRAFFDRVWNGRELDLLDEIVHPECVTHQLRSEMEAAPEARGPAALRHHVEAWLRAVPDIRFDVKQMLVDGDRVATQCTMIGTHRDSWMGVPPTGRTLRLACMTIHRVDGGTIAEDWVLIESYGVFLQLGLVPPRQDMLKGAAAGRSA
jgi:steroid delta-isomerase-like uncharacterized protein